MLTRDRYQDSPDAAAVDALDEVVGQKRGEVALDAAAVRLPDVALSIAQVARRGEQPPHAPDLKDRSPRGRADGGEQGTGRW